MFFFHLNLELTSSAHRYLLFIYGFLVATSPPLPSPFLSFFSLSLGFPSYFPKLLTF